MIQSPFAFTATLSDRPITPGASASAPRRLALGVPGFTYASIRDVASLPRLTAAFDAFVGAWIFGTKFPDLEVVDLKTAAGDVDAFKDAAHDGAERVLDDLVIGDQAVRRRLGHGRPSFAGLRPQVAKGAALVKLRRDDRRPSTA
jgi:hypothetical protein